MSSEYPKKSKALRDQCSSHQKLESEEENNCLKVELVKHLEELPIKEEPIEEKNHHRQPFPVISGTKL